MIGFVIFVHIVICILLAIVILMQSGRGGGLTEGLASAESIFGAKTNAFMVKTTTVLATLFLIASLGLAVLSSQKDKSLMANSPIPMSQRPVTQTMTNAIIDTTPDTAAESN